MAKTIRNQYSKYLTYENLMKAHLQSRKNKNNKPEIILFNLKQEEYIRWLYEELKNKTYKHGGYKTFYIYEPKKRKIKDEDVLWLTKEIIYSSEGDKGIPIGNYTSQIFANIYLNEIDQCIKHKLKIKYYYRYMDDSVLIIKTKKEAKQVLEKIKEYLKQELYLELNSKTQIFKNKQGVNFCGYKIKENRMKIRDKGKRKLKKKIKILRYGIRTGKLTSKDARKYLCGHIGYIQYANIDNLINKVFVKD